MKILVTGGCGYIGSHTIVDLVQHGYDVISVDDNSRSSDEILEGVKAITGKTIKNYKVDLCNQDDVFAVFRENKISGIIHFAAFKAVGESTEQPLMYFENNLGSLINVLKAAEAFKVPHFVFSSSCTVYGTPDVLPVTESSPLKPAESPYGATKQIGEEMIRQYIANKTGMKAVLLRYFNPAGAHESIEIGEQPVGAPQNLVPAITQTAIGKLPQLKVWGKDYATKDGTCVRDYIHVSDIAAAHTLALKKCEKDDTERLLIYNLGTGTGYTVLEVIRAFEKVSGKPLNYEIAERRAGDVEAIYADNRHAKIELNWEPKHDLEGIMRTAWEREKRGAMSDER